jgi:glucose/arabinose dehydrogenase
MDLYGGVGHGHARLALAAFVVLALLVTTSSARAETLPAGFDDREVASAPQATAFAFVPGGRILITSQLGQLYVFDGNATHLALDLDALGRICNNVERGVLGVAVDPAFVDQHYIYLYYTYRKNGTCGPSARRTRTGCLLARWAP